MHRIAIIAATLISCFGLAVSAALAADDTSLKAPTLVVSGYGSVEYRPDTAHVTLGVRAEASTAGAASAQVASSAQSVVAAMHRLGIADRDLRTTGFSLYYQQPQPRPMPMMMTPGAASATSAPPAGGTSAPLPNEPRRMYPTGAGTYVATEEIFVKTTPGYAGAVIDAAVSAGANQTYGLTFDSSARDALMRQALERAVKNARENADAIAAAAGLRILGVQMIESAGGPPRVLGMRTYDTFAPMGAASAQPPILAGTDTVSTSVVVVFRVR